MGCFVPSLSSTVGTADMRSPAVLPPRSRRTALPASKHAVCTKALAGQSSTASTHDSEPAALDESIFILLSHGERKGSQY